MLLVLFFVVVDVVRVIAIVVNAVVRVLLVFADLFICSCGQ